MRKQIKRTPSTIDKLETTFLGVSQRDHIHNLDDHFDIGEVDNANTRSKYG